MQDAGVVRFSLLARQIGDEARRLGLTVPGFRSPPRLPGADRTIRRTRAGTTVAVRRQGRAPSAIATDLIEGILAANDLAPAQRSAARTHLHRSVRPLLPAAA